MNNTETAHRISCPSIIIYSLFTIHSSLRRCQAPFLSLPNTLDFCKTCVIRHKNPPSDETIGGFAAGRPPLVGATGFEPAASKSQTSRATNCATPRKLSRVVLIIIHLRTRRVNRLRKIFQNLRKNWVYLFTNW